MTSSKFNSLIFGILLALSIIPLVSADNGNGTAGFSPRFLSGVSVFQNGIWIIGGTDNHQISGDVWYIPLSDSSPAPTAPVPTAFSLSSNTSAVPAMPGTTAQAGSDPFSSGVVILTALGVCMHLIKRRDGGKSKKGGG